MIQWIIKLNLNYSSNGLLFLVPVESFQKVIRMAEYSTLEWTKFLLNIVRFSFTGFVAFSFKNDDVVVTPFDFFLLLVGIFWSTSLLIYSCSRLDFNNPSIIFVGNQITASGVILIAIFSMNVNFFFRHRLINMFKLLDSSDQLVSNFLFTRKLKTIDNRKLFQQLRKYFRVNFSRDFILFITVSALNATVLLPLVAYMIQNNEEIGDIGVIFFSSVLFSLSTNSSFAFVNSILSRVKALQKLVLKFEEKRDIAVLGHCQKLFEILLDMLGNQNKFMGTQFLFCTGVIFSHSALTIYYIIKVFILELVSQHETTIMLWLIYALSLLILFIFLPEKKTNFRKNSVPNLW